MLSLTDNHFTDDKMMWDWWLSRYHLATIAAADHLNIFQIIAEGSTSIQDVSNSLQLDLKGTEAIILLLISLGLIKKQNNKLFLTEISCNYLRKTSAFYWGKAFNRIYAAQEYKRIINIFKAQKDAQLKESKKNLNDMWESGVISKTAAKRFTDIMHATIFQASTLAINSGLFDHVQYLLDVGGGSGCFATEFIKKYPLSKAGIFELNEVCTVAKRYLKDFKMESKINLIKGNFFQDEFPKLADGILFSNIFHDWRPEVGLMLAKKAYRALPEKGRIFIHEMLLNEDKTGPLTTATFNLLMYLNHGSQQFTKAEIFHLLEEAGFRNCTQQATHSYYSIIVALK